MSIAVFEQLNLDVNDQTADKTIDDLKKDIESTKTAITKQLSSAPSIITEAIEKYRAIKQNLSSQKAKLAVAMRELDEETLKTNNEISKLQNTLDILLCKVSPKTNQSILPLEKRMTFGNVVLETFVDKTVPTVSKILTLKQIVELNEAHKITICQIKYWIKNEGKDYIEQTSRPVDTNERGLRTYFFKLTKAGLELANKNNA
jgi:hypothetical protein